MKKNLILYLSLLFLASFSSGCQIVTTQPTLGTAKSTPAWTTSSWPVSSPEEQGLDSQKIDRAFEFIDNDLKHLDIHSLLIVRHGHIVVEKYFSAYTETKRHALFSCTKSFISALIGIAIEEGYIRSIEQPVLDFFPGRNFRNLNSDKQNLTLKNLLTMRAGLEWKEGNPAYQALYISRDWVSFMLDKPMVVTPGIQFNYCSGCSHLLSAVITNATGMNTLEYAQSRLFEPLGIQNVYWEKDVNDIPIGGWGLELTPRDMAKFGYLYLHNGEWEGKQIIPEKWVYISTQANQEFKDGWGYGYHWWVNPSYKTYAAQGLHGQKIYIFPNLDMVIVVTAGLDDASVMWEVVKNFILPSVR